MMLGIIMLLLRFRLELDKIGIKKSQILIDPLPILKVLRFKSHFLRKWGQTSGVTGRILIFLPKIIVI
jgi:hypothetical protein